MRALFVIPRSEPPPALEGSFSPPFKAFVSACLQKDPAARPSAATLLSHPFLALAAELPASFRAHIAACAALPGPPTFVEVRCSCFPRINERSAWFNLACTMCGFDAPPVNDRCIHSAPLMITTSTVDSLSSLITSQGEIRILPMWFWPFHTDTESLQRREICTVGNLQSWVAILLQLHLSSLLSINV